MGIKKLKTEELKLIYRSYGKVWKSEDLDYLYSSWGIKSIEAMSRHLDRPEPAIKQKAVKLGMGRRTDNNTDITLRSLFMALGFYKSESHMLEIFVKYNAPITTMKTCDNEYRMINVDKFWKWADLNKKHLNFAKFKKGLLGFEPDWVDEKRKLDIKNPSKKNWNRKWTTYEDNLLISKLKLYRYTYEDLSKEFNRTEQAIKRRICTLKIMYKPISRSSHIKWTDEENKKLIEMHSKGATAYDIGKALNKSGHSIDGRIKNIGNEASMSGRWTESEILYLKNNWESLDINSIANNLGRTYFSVRKKASRLELQNEYKLKI